MQINKDIKEGYNNKIKNLLFGLLCEYEKGREWEAFLDSIVIELQGLEDETKGINYYRLLAKVNSLRYLSYKHFRTTIFDCMNMVSSL